MDHYLRPGQRSSKREHPGIHEGVIASCRVVLHSTAKHFVLADFVRGLFRSFKSSTQEQASPARHRLLIRHHEAEQGLATTFCTSRSVTRYCRSLRRTNEMHGKGELRLGEQSCFGPLQKSQCPTKSTSSPCTTSLSSSTLQESQDPRNLQAPT